LGSNTISAAKFRVTLYLLLQEEKMRMVLVTRRRKLIFVRDKLQLSILLFPFSI